MRGAGVAGVVLAALLAAVPASAARGPAVRVSVVRAERSALTVKVAAVRATRVTVAAAGKSRALRVHGTLRKTLRLPLALPSCEAQRVTVTVRAGRASAKDTATVPSACPAAPLPAVSPAPAGGASSPRAESHGDAAAPRGSDQGGAPQSADGQQASGDQGDQGDQGGGGQPTYRVGAAVRSINPDADGTYGGAPVYLGGYGIGGGSPLFEGRPATGILGHGVHVRAIAISDGKHQVAIADAELQGWFVATKDGHAGILDVRKAVQQRTNGAIKASQVIVQSDHTHGGPDLMGVWGGASVAYRDYVAKQTEDALVEAIAGEQPAALTYGTTDGRDLQSNQFDYDAANKVMDSDVRVLQAKDPRSGDTIATLLNFSAHPTVLGSSNTKATGDWVSEANPMLEARFGGKAVTMVGTLGRSQPADRGCHDSTLKGDDESLCSLDDYAGRVVDRAAQAVDNAHPVGGAPDVDARSYLITDPATNGFLLGILVAGDPIGLPVNRAEAPPWLTGNVLGTTTQSARIGDILLSAAPGEMYPQIALKIRDIAGGLRGYMTAGLAGDQLGYLMAPYEAYPEPIRRTAFNQRGDEVSPIDNDNYAFNVSTTMGERVTCSLLRGAGELFGQSGWRGADDRCLPFVNDSVLPAGSDVGG
jgi:hypothetical protein